MGHETGHFLGLFHTQEFAQGITDQIDDTATGFNNADNLMFPTVTPEEAQEKVTEIMREMNPKIDNAEFLKMVQMVLLILVK